MNRREWLNTCGALIGAGLWQEPVPPTNVRYSQRQLIGFNDLAWLGMCHVADTGFSYNQGQLAVRYVNGERRVLMAKWHQGDASHGYMGNLVEFRLPTLAQTAATSQPMTAVREWVGWCWTPPEAMWPSLANGWIVGGFWWDTLQQVLWYTTYPYYGPGVVDMPFLHATALHDDTTVTQYGPWRYVSPTANLYRKVCIWLVPIPPSAQSDVGGRRIALGGTMMSAAGGLPVNWGPGLTAVHLPALGSTDPVEPGIPLADYSPGAGGLVNPWNHCRRERDYIDLNTSGGAIPSPIGTEGFWQSSADTMTGLAWLETPDRHGLMMIGQRAANHVWYGFADSYNTIDPLTGQTVHSPLPEGVAIDTMMPSQGSTGYHSDGWQSALWRFDPTELRQAARGERKSNAEGMRPTRLGQWHTVWTQIPRPLNRPYTSHGVASSAVDVVANELIWAQAVSKKVGDYGYMPSVHVFKVG